MTPWLLNLAKFCKHPADETKRHKVAHILDKLITLTIEEVEMYPSIQAKIWGNIGQVSELIDLVLDSFIKRSVTGGLGSAQAEIMAETAVSLSAANVALVARKVIWRLCRVIGKFNFTLAKGPSIKDVDPIYLTPSFPLSPLRNTVIPPNSRNLGVG